MHSAGTASRIIHDFALCFSRRNHCQRLRSLLIRITARVSTTKFIYNGMKSAKYLLLECNNIVIIYISITIIIIQPYIPSHVLGRKGVGEHI